MIHYPGRLKTKSFLKQTCSGKKCRDEQLLTGQEEVSWTTKNDNNVKVLPLKKANDVVLGQIINYVVVCIYVFLETIVRKTS